MTVVRFIRADVLPVLKNARALKALMTPDDRAGALPLAFQHVTTAEEIDILARRALTAAPILTLRDGRVKAQVDRHRRLTQIISERAGHVDYRDAPGGRTGLLVRRAKKDGDEFAVDSALLSELREHEKQIAIELGQWQESTGQASMAVQINVSPGNGPLPRVSFDTEHVIDSEDLAIEIGETQRSA